MSLDAVIFDVDGTLVDTNQVHVECWWRAFERAGFTVSASRIAPEIGKGGDLLVSAILGEDVEKQYGETLRQYWIEEFLQTAANEQFTVFPDVPQLLYALRERGLRLAIATSGKKQVLEAIEKSTQCDFQAMVDAVITADDAEQSKPAPDLVVAAVEKLGLTSKQCVMVGDTPYDAEACQRAGVMCWGVLSGGHTPETLQRAGVQAVWNDAADLLAHLDEALAR